MTDVEAPAMKVHREKPTTLEELQALYADSPDETDRIERSPIDMDAPINVDQISEAIGTIGPLRVRSEHNPYAIEIRVFRCPCGSPVCQSEDIFVIQRRNGLFSIQWMLEASDLLQAFDSMNHLRRAVLAGALSDTSYERQIVEQHIRAEFGTSYFGVDGALTCFCDACAEHVGKERLSNRMLLSQMALALSDRWDFIEDARERFGQEGEVAVEAAFNLGYALGRQFSEYQVKLSIEQDAIAGKQFQEFKAKRAHSAGLKSSGKRLESGHC